MDKTRSWYIGFAPFGDVLLSGKVTDTIVIASLYTRVSIYVTVNWNSDTVVALSPSKRVYAILWKMNTCLVLSLSKRVYTLWKETECTEKLYKPLMLCYLRLKKYTLTLVSMLWTMKLRIHHSHCCASRSMLDHHILSSCSASASPFSRHDVSSSSDLECTDVFWPEHIRGL